MHAGWVLAFTNFAFQNVQTCLIATNVRITFEGQAMRFDKVATKI